MVTCIQPRLIPPSHPASQRFVDEVRLALRSFYSKGVKATLTSYIEAIETER